MANSWLVSVKAARKKLKIKGFEPIRKGSRLYKEAKKIHEKKKGGSRSRARGRTRRR